MGTIEELGVKGNLRPPQAVLLRMADEIPGILWATDRDLRITSCWGAGLVDLGLRSNQLVGMTAFEYFGSDDPEFPVIAAHGRALEGETIALEQDWQGKTYQVRVAPLRDQEGRIVGCSGIAHDVTELKRARESLEESEAKFRALVEQSLQGVIVVQDFRIVFANAALAHILGYPVEELTALPRDRVRAIVHPEDQALVWGRFLARTQGKPVPPLYEYRVIRKDGTVRWVEMFSKAFSYDGRPAIQGAVVDITERKRTEKALRLSEARARALLKVPLDAMYLLDADGAIVDANEAGAQRLNCSVHELVGTCIFDWLPPEVAQKRRGKVEEVARTAKPLRFEDERQGRFYDSTLYPVFDEEGNVIQVAVSARDVTDRRRTEESLRLAQVELDQRVQQRTAELIAANDKLRLEIAEREQVEQRLRVLSSAVAQSKEGMAVTDLDGRLLFVNESFAAMHGYCPAELMGKHLSVFHTPDQMPAVEAAVRYMRETGHFHGEVPHARHDGTAFPCMMHSSLLRDEGGRPTGMIATMRDVTEQKRAEEALRESEERFRFAFEEGPLGIAMIGSDRRFVRVNRALCRILGYTRAELIGCEVASITHSEDRERCSTVSQQVLKGEIASGTWENRYFRSDGKIIWARVTTGVVRDEDGNVMYGLAMVEETTKRRQAEMALRESETRRMEAEKLAASGRLAARVAHEINNPLAGIMNSFQLVKAAVPEDHRHHRFAQIIEKEIERIGRIVRQMFQLHRLHQEAIRDVRVADTLDDVVTILEPNFRERRVQVETRADPPDVTIRIPEGSLRQVLYNLAVNAIEASPPHGVIRIAASTAATDGAIEITVADQGGGIPDDVQDRIFEPFFTTKEGGATAGLGLGLSISKGIVDSLRGTLDFECPPGNGTTFRVVLPSAAD